MDIINKITKYLYFDKHLNLEYKKYVLNKLFLACPNNNIIHKLIEL